MSECNERAAALRVTSVRAQLWSTQLKSCAEELELPAIFLRWEHPEPNR